MRWPGYSGYKKSGVRWLEQIPEQWDTVSLKWVSRRYAGGTPDKSNSAYWEDGDIPWLNSGSVNDGCITEPSAYITKEGFANSSAKWIPKKALVMALAGQGKTKGMVAQLGIEATCNQSMAAIIPKPNVLPRYLYWWLVSNYKNIRNMAGGEQRDGLNLEMLGSIPCPLASVPEQTAIANFLDRETGRIDTLVAKKRRLIALLKEKRTALISRTVTRGLPEDAAREFGLEPHTRFKDSGIEWLGDVPEGWEVKPLKRAIKFIEGPGIMASDFMDDGVPLLRISCIGGRKVTLNGCNHVAENLATSKWAHFRVKIHDLLISGSASTGFCSEVDEVAAGAIPYTGIIIIRPCEDVSRDFIRWFFLADYFADQTSLAKTGATIQHFGPSHLAKMTITLPREPEQIVIANYLDRETTKIDKLVEKVEAAITRLQEYRTALITAAVTGKIDVRKAVA